MSDSHSATRFRITPLYRRSGVYQIRNLVDGKRYVGSASKSIKERWGNHIKTLRKGTHHSKYLQRAWRKHGEAAFVFEVLIFCDPQNCIMYEQLCIDRFQVVNRSLGYNISPTAGNNRGLKMSPERIAKMVAIHRGRKASPETRALMSAGRKGLKRSPEAVAKTAAAHTGMKRRKETCDKIGASHRGRKWTPEQKARHSLRLFGRKLNLSAETRAKLSALHKGKFLSQETRDKYRATMQRKKLTPGYRTLMRQNLRSIYCRKPGSNQLELFTDAQS